MDIHIEGNIGAGKSTLLNFIKDNLECNISQEPVGEWMKMDLLDKFYSDIDRWSFAFQMNCFISRAHQVDQLPEGMNFIERSVLSDKIFAQNCYENGNMEKTEFDIYEKWSNWLYTRLCKKVKNVIYLRSTPEVSYERIKKRSRDGEEAIPLLYLRQLHNLHDNWLIENENINVIVLDADNLKYDQNLIEVLKTSFFGSH
jgi:deoxynucleoside kinase